MSKVIQCAFVLNEVARTSYGSKLTFGVVCDKDGKYKDYFEATPAGQLWISTIKRDLADELEPGKTYVVDIREAT